MRETLEITFKGVKYTSEPMKVGNFVDFNKLKAALSGGQYGNIWRMGTADGDQSLLMIDIESTLTIFFPKMMEKFKPSSISDLGLKDYSEVRKLYLNDIKPWILEHTKMLNDVEEDSQ